MFDTMAVYGMYLLLISLTILLIINRKIFQMKKKTFIILVIIFIFAFSLRMFVFPHFHRMYIDEVWYSQMAMEMNEGAVIHWHYFNDPLNTGLTKPPFWPFLFSVIYRIFGADNYYALYLSSFLGSLSVFLIFFVTRSLFKSRSMGLFSASILALSPLHIFWSLTAESNIAAVFFSLLTIFAFLSWKKGIPWLLIVSFIVSVLIRFETVLLLPICIIYHHKKKLYSNYHLIIFVFVTSMIILEAVYFKMFRLTMLTKAFYYLNFIDFLKSSSFYFIYLIIGLMGFFFFKKKDMDSMKFLISLLMVFFIFYLPLYKFAEQRMALLPLVFFIIFCSYGLSRISSKYFLSIFAILLLVSHVLAIYNMNDLAFRYRRQILETEIHGEIVDTIPKDTLIVTEHCAVVRAVSNVDCMETRDFLADPVDFNEVYYLYDGFCLSRPICDVEGSQERCQKLLEKHDFDIIKLFKNKKIIYFIARLDTQNISHQLSH